MTDTTKAAPAPGASIQTLISTFEIIQQVAPLIPGFVNQSKQVVADAKTIVAHIQTNFTVNTTIGDLEKLLQDVKTPASTFAKVIEESKNVTF